MKQAASKQGRSDISVKEVTALVITYFCTVSMKLEVASTSEFVLFSVTIFIWIGCKLGNGSRLCWLFCSYWLKQRKKL